MTCTCDETPDTLTHKCVHMMIGTMKHNNSALGQIDIIDNKVTSSPILVYVLTSLPHHVQLVILALPVIQFN